MEREHVSQLLIDGFLPRCSLEDRPATLRASGFQQLGLPFESDTAITRHMAAFLHSQAAADRSALPTHVLLNGGVFAAAAMRTRLLEVFEEWGDADVQTRLLEGTHDLHHAVARGAAAYGWTKQHGGVRIRGGVARSYYIGVETAGLAIPGAPRPLQALCVVPFGMEEGTETDVPSAEVGLVLGEPAEFRFFSSATRKDDRPGDVLRRWDESELTETAPLQTTLPADGSVEEPFVPVHFQSRITELGMFELWCVSNRGNERWKLEFNVREADQGQ